ncbi:AraC family transcriptional regulator [Mammaliicoccus lentus]|uniref:AraC family transcriptional regulator n=1 Tax=Mammaliicoccus lentus TaxID=42858 RepID=UPI00374E3DB0
MSEEYLSQIFELTEHEKKYLENENYQSPIYKQMKQIVIDNKLVYKFELKKLNENIIEIRKDSRFTSVPMHIHSNININYIYSGKCHYNINGEEVTLYKGDVCILDRNVLRSKQKIEENDIIINISLSNDFFSTEFINKLSESSILSTFLFSVISKNNQHNSFLIFRNNNSYVERYFEELIEENIERKTFYQSVSDSLLNLIFVQLIRNYQLNKKEQIIHLNSTKSNNMLEILEYIEVNADNCTLNEIALKYNYHPKHLSLLIKETFGKTFKEIQTMQRLKNATYYLKNTDISISDICEKIGMKNVNHFYKKFYEVYNCTPSTYRNMI